MLSCRRDTEILVVKDKELIRLFQQLITLALKSAEDLQRLYDSFCKDRIDRKARITFYGKVPCTAQEMLLHVDRSWLLPR